MGFKKVYSSLQEVFPEVDSRVLRAVAIEHCKDPDAAVEVVLTEVIPFLTERSKPLPASSPKNGALAQSSFAAVDLSETFLKNDVSLKNASSTASSCNEKQNDLSSYDAICEQGQPGQYHQASNAIGQQDVLEGNISGNLISFQTCESSVRVCPDLSSNITSFKSNPEVAAESSNADKCESSGTQEPACDVHEKCAGKDDYGDKCEFSESLETSASNLHEESTVFPEYLNVPVEINGLAIHGDSSTTHKDTCNEKSLYSDSLDHASSNIQACESNAGLVVEAGMENVLPEATVLNGFINVVSDTSELLNADMEPIANSIVTRSGQICRIDLLEDIIAEARSNKKTMFAAMESLISLMREVELQEKAAEQAKEEAAIGGLDILKRVEDLKEMLKHAKEANDMHAGEVYGEKAILATEVKELQSRLLNLADERDKSLAILDEMRQTLEVRLDAAEREREAAEQEKLQKEEVARKALVEQELIMEKVVQDSNILKREAEENAKLQEFLVDRGRIVDMLQGEISVICQDVRLLKEKFDDRVPLSKSLSSSQTSCILASSSSSLKSLVPDSDQVAADQTNLSGRQNIDSTSAEETRNNCKALMEDGWEIFDNRELCM
nr:rab11 family-interacting protein 3 isoform X2 [Ipomoea batatas]GMD27904.1 rab11 family-interacting protein 3 isoform X2 [Ipomoea batatas]